MWVCFVCLAFVCVWPWVLRLSALMLLGVSLVPLCNYISSSGRGLEGMLSVFFTGGLWWVTSPSFTCPPDRPGSRMASWLGCGMQGCCEGAGLPARDFRPPLRVLVCRVFRAPQGSSSVVASFIGGPSGASRELWPFSGRLHLGGAPGVRRCLVPWQRVPGPVRLVRSHAGVCPVWMTCVAESRACLVWVCLVRLASVCVCPRLFAFRRPCC
jgi:hypothetical protein